MYCLYYKDEIVMCFDTESEAIFFKKRFERLFNVKLVLKKEK